MSFWRWTREEWFALPLEVRQLWWRDTDYNKRAPSPEMLGILEGVRRGEDVATAVSRLHEPLIAPCNRCGIRGPVVRHNVETLPMLCFPCFCEECRRVEDKTDGSIGQVLDYLRREKLH
jgi:hypothetical protein